MSNQTQTHYQACNLCEAICGLEIKTRGREILSIKGDNKDPLSQGHICPKAVALQDIHTDPERLRQPVRKTADGWESLSWEEAFDEVVKGLKKVQAQYGKDAVGVYRGNPTVHSLGIMLCASRLLKQLGTRNCYSATSVDQLPHHIVAGLMFGHELLLPVPDIDRTRCMIILGANPLVSNGSMMTVPKVGKRLKALQARGGKLWVIDPRKTETAELADKHVFIQPGSDAHLLAAMVNTVFEEKLCKNAPVMEWVDGLEDLRKLITPWTPEAVESLTGISATCIRRMVREFCAADGAVLYGRMGVSTQEFGTLCQWLIVVFNIITGNFDEPGGAMFTTPAIDILASRKHSRKQKKPSNKSAFSFGRFRSRVKSLPEMQGELPVATLADEMLTEGEGQIKAMMLIAGNPVLSTPNGRRFSKALEALDFVVAVDFYINETSRHANIILPPATILERDHYDLVFHALAVRNTARYSPAVFQTDKTVKSDAEIILELSARLQSHNNKPGFLKRFRLQHLVNYGIRRALNNGLKKGPYGKTHGLNLKKLLQAPHGLDFGPLQKVLPQRLFTRNKRIDLIPAEIIGDLPRLQMQLTGLLNLYARFAHNMILIGRRDPRTCNSWMHNSQRLTKGRERCVAHIHPKDARRLKLESGCPVRVSSEVGSIEIDVVVTDTIKPGVISIPHGWGHNLPGVRMSCAVENSGVSINDLTDNGFYDAVSGNAALNGVPVKVEALGVATQTLELTG